VAAGGFRERDPAGEGDYLQEVLGDGVSRDALIESMETLLAFTNNATYAWTDDYGTLIWATVARSGRTFDGICRLLRAGLAVQAAMLCRSLFEDMIVGHWLLFNHEDPDWLVERFLRHREAIALHQERLRAETGGAGMGPPLNVPSDAKSREQLLIEEFGPEAQKDWWDPGRKGRGVGQPVGIRKIVNLLEDAAAEHKMFHPRFAGGEQPLLRRMDKMTHKWLNQCIHHTTIGLPFTPVAKGESEKSPDPMMIVAWNASWLFTQQAYLAHDAAGIADGRMLEAAWWECMIVINEAIGGRNEWTERLERELMEILGVDLSGVPEVGRLYGAWWAVGERFGWWWLRLKSALRRSG
jgi:Family of unknown function (DUF5677)